MRRQLSAAEVARLPDGTVIQVAWCGWSAAQAAWYELGHDPWGTRRVRLLHPGRERRGDHWQVLDVADIGPAAGWHRCWLDEAGG